MSDDSQADPPKPTRRTFLRATGTSAAAAMVAVSVPASPAPPPSAADTAEAAAAAGTVPVTLRINGQNRSLRVDPRTSLLDCIRETVTLTGTKKGCDHGQCGACTVHVNGRRALSCLSLAVMHDGHEITTIEGLGTPDALHPMQAAFVAFDGYQCGYCTSGQIMSAVALLKEPCGPGSTARRPPTPAQRQPGGLHRGGQRGRAADRRALLDYPDKEINELGARGIGEIGMAGVAAAVTAAVYHATGVRVRELPVKIEDLLA